MSHSLEHAISEWLTGFTATWHPPAESRRMLPDTARIVKQRDIPPHQMSYVTCDADAGSRDIERWHWTVQASRDDRGRWIASGVTGGSGPIPQRGRPWADLGGNWGQNGFRAGGTVEDAGAGIERVRLTDRNGRSFEDIVENGVVLFCSDEPVVMPMRLELVDDEGEVVDTDEWGFVDE